MIPFQNGDKNREISPPQSTKPSAMKSTHEFRLKSRLVHKAFIKHYKNPY